MLVTCSISGYRAGGPCESGKAYHLQPAARLCWQDFGTPVGPLPGLKPVTGEAWTPRFDPVPAVGKHTAKFPAAFGTAKDTSKDKTP